MQLLLKCECTLMAQEARVAYKPIRQHTTHTKHGLHVYAAEALSRKDAAQMMDNRDDPEVNAAVKEYMRAQFKGGKAAEKVEETFELASKVERKYVAAQTVEYGIQVRIWSMQSATFEERSARQQLMCPFLAEHCRALGL